MNILKFKMVLFCTFLTVDIAYSQEDVFNQIRFSQDSLLQLIEKETDVTRKIDLIMAIYKTRVEAYPLMVIEVGQKLNKSAQKTGDPITEAVSWAFFGQGYRLSGNYTKGLECHHKALELAESIGNKSLLAMCQNQIAHIYKDREENEKALRLYHTALSNANAGANAEVRIWPIMNLGAIHLAMNNLDSSLLYSKEAYARCEAVKLFRNRPYILGNIAGAYSKLGIQDTAMMYYKKAIDFAISSQSPRFINQVYTSLAEHYQRFGHQDSTLFYAKKAIALTQNTVFTFLSIKPAKLLTDIYEKTSADSTLKYLKIYRTAYDSLFSSQAEQQLQMMTFEEDQRQQDLANAQINYKNKIKMNMMLGGLGTFLLIVLILFRNNKQKQKANALLHRQKKEIENTLSQLKATQAQLVHSEKMASLGELTAGIAHEIQNPLNFVNNFSEVSNELLDEMRNEMAADNKQEVINISNDVKQNLEKILFHGKRADAIVKGMLQHSRSGSATKEPTDLNALADEYLRLAYHGLRAKDKSFNATFTTDFDTNLPKVNVIPQDIGRVLLNLITNAFHAVSAPKGDLDYIPTVHITTKLTKSPPGDLGANRAEISVTDNGPGIPDAIKEKIFQPFFTTKPTGQGTGLGLSLSYDIIKAHGGDIVLDSVPGEYARFVITLPIL